MSCACGCDLSIAMRDTLRALHEGTFGDFRPWTGPHTLKLSRECAGRSPQSIRNSLRGLVRRKLVQGPNTWDQFRIRDAGELWCMEHA